MMKSNFSLYIELISNQKFTKEDLANFKSSLENEPRIAAFSDVIAESSNLNFTGHIEVYVEDLPQETDLISDIEKAVVILDQIVVGGWANDSKIEWLSHAIDSSFVWFKDEDQWKSVVKETERFFDEEAEWDEYGRYDDDNYSDRYQDEDY